MGYMSLMISQCYPVGFGYILYCCQMRKTLLIRFWCAIQVGKKFLHWLESDQPRDAARREECSNRMKRVFLLFIVVTGGRKGFAREHQNGFYET
jgi:hypothetical protein